MIFFKLYKFLYYFYIGQTGFFMNLVISPNISFLHNITVVKFLIYYNLLLLKKKLIFFFFFVSKLIFFFKSLSLKFYSYFLICFFLSEHCFLSKWLFWIRAFSEEDFFFLSIGLMICVFLLVCIFAFMKILFFFLTLFYTVFQLIFDTKLVFSFLLTRYTDFWVWIFALNESFSFSESSLFLVIFIIFIQIWLFLIFLIWNLINVVLFLLISQIVKYSVFFILYFYKIGTIFLICFTLKFSALPFFLYHTFEPYLLLFVPFIIFPAIHTSLLDLKAFIPQAWPIKFYTWYLRVYRYLFFIILCFGLDFFLLSLTEKMLFFMKISFGIPQLRQLVHATLVSDNWFVFYIFPFFFLFIAIWGVWYYDFYDSILPDIRRVPLRFSWKTRWFPDLTKYNWVFFRKITNSIYCIRLPYFPKRLKFRGEIKPYFWIKPKMYWHLPSLSYQWQPFRLKLQWNQELFAYFPLLTKHILVYNPFFKKTIRWDYRFQFFRFINPLIRFHRYYNRAFDLILLVWGGFFYCFYWCSLIFKFKLLFFNLLVLETLQKLLQLQFIFKKFFINLKFFFDDAYLEYNMDYRVIYNKKNKLITYFDGIYTSEDYETFGESLNSDHYFFILKYFGSCFHGKHGQFFKVSGPLLYGEEDIFKDSKLYWKISRSAKAFPDISFAEYFALDWQAPVLEKLQARFPTTESSVLLTKYTENLKLQVDYIFDYVYDEVFPNLDWHFLLFLHETILHKIFFAYFFITKYFMLNLGWFLLSLFHIGLWPGFIAFIGFYGFLLIKFFGEYLTHPHTWCWIYVPRMVLRAVFFDIIDIIRYFSITKEQLLAQKEWEEPDWIRYYSAIAKFEYTKRWRKTKYGWLYNNWKVWRIWRLSGGLVTKESIKYFLYSRAQYLVLTFKTHWVTRWFYLYLVRWWKIKKERFPRLLKYFR